jgi:hypothetical protein
MHVVLLPVMEHAINQNLKKKTHIHTASVIIVYADHTYMIRQTPESVKYDMLHVTLRYVMLCYVQYLIPVP